MSSGGRRPCRFLELQLGGLLMASAVRGTGDMMYL